MPHRPSGFSRRGLLFDFIEVAIDLPHNFIVIDKRRFPVDRLVALASARSAGTTLEFRGDRIPPPTFYSSVARPDPNRLRSRPWTNASFMTI